jgi:hypothetical protein
MIYLKTASLPPKRQILNNNINLLWFLFEIKGLLFHKGVGGFPYCKASSIYHHCNVKIAMLSHGIHKMKTSTVCLLG